MEDEEILALFRARAEDAVAAASEKYGRRCRTVARNILADESDAEECVSDALLAAWNAIPPQSPRYLGAYLARITRNLALNRIKAASTRKRGGGETALALEELVDCASPAPGPEETLESGALTAAIEGFLRSLPAEQRRLFLRRYWYLCSVKDIARAMGVGESRVKSRLARLRKALRAHLEKEGFSV